MMMMNTVNSLVIGVAGLVLTIQIPVSGDPNPLPNPLPNPQPLPLPQPQG